MRLRSAAVLFSVGAVLVLSACTSTPSESGPPQDVKVGLLAPLTGSNADLGQQALHGAELAAVVVNPGGSAPLPIAGRGLPGLGGAKIKIVEADTRGDPDQSATQGINLANQRVAGIVSADSGKDAAGASERTERIGVPFIGAVASADFLTERGLEWFFRVAPTDSMFSQAGLDVLEQRGGGIVRRIGIVHANDAASTEAATAFQNVAPQANDAIVADIGFNQGSTADGIRPKLDQVGAASPQATIAVAERSDDARAVLTADQSDGQRSVSLTTGPGFTAQAIRQVTAASSASILHSTAWSLDFAARNPAASAVADLYQKRFKAPMTAVAAEAFTAIVTLAQAIDAAGSADPALVRTALLGLNVPGRDTIMPWGGIRFDQTGQNTLAAALVEQVTPTTAGVVFPPELAASKT